MKYLAIFVFAVCMIGVCSSESQAQCYRGGYYGGHGHYHRHYHHRPTIHFSYGSYPRHYYGGHHYRYRPHYGHHHHGHIRYGHYGRHRGWSIGFGF